jgi:uncharacterized protein (DUF488 family)
MIHFGETVEKTRKNNAGALAAFGLDEDENTYGSCYRVVHHGSGPSIFTIGYERRDGEDLFSMLIDSGVEVLVDVRERPMSRKPDFRKKALIEFCDEYGVDYCAMPELGSTGKLRDDLRDSGDFKKFRRKFRTLAKRMMEQPISQLAELEQFI